MSHFLVLSMFARSSGFSPPRCLRTLCHSCCVPMLAQHHVPKPSRSRSLFRSPFPERRQRTRDHVFRTRQCPFSNNHLPHHQMALAKKRPQQIMSMSVAVDLRSTVAPTEPHSLAPPRRTTQTLNITAAARPRLTSSLLD
ncbi:uncharacterized protein CC84DRAFT_576746 [Paraphaeosphaeria sporulosa]|uniref:Uncharacterized protein n=1 Tax=Paraphaeosphaeria sporulosa TaxID=1460663 RepID=A0A177CNE5_9PLEO|nr:uncharacterized protein CC84DRAFT_576746 [Paraphaeosphaeria sporulosa]OAG08420.1 hypothetical protein CC84DRAFT_576746 [Paraphaeosphaeria sporulosa]